MKKFIGIVVIIAALVLGSYYGMGIITERTLTKTVDVVNHANGIFVDIERYDRGWFSSSAVLNWRLHVPERVIQGQNGQSTTIAAEDYKMQMPLAIHHGPFMLADSGLRFGLGYAQSELEIPAIYLDKFSSLFSSDSVKPRLNVSLFVNYLNNTRLHVSLPSFKLISKQGDDNLEWYGMDASLSVSSNLKALHGKLEISGAKLTKNMMQTTLGKFSSDYDLHQTDNGIYLGGANVSLPSLVIMDNKEQIFEVERFGIHSKSDVVDGLFNSYFKSSLDKMTVKGKHYGPGYLDMALKNLDAQVLADINQQANKMQQGTDAERQQALLAMLPELPKLFGKGAQFDVSKLSMVLPEGAVEGDLMLLLPKGEAGNPFQLLQKVQGHALLKVPTTVVADLVRVSVRQKLLNQSTIQQAMIQQMSNNTAAASQAPATAVPAKATPGIATAEVPAAPVDDATQIKPMSAAEVDKQATAQTDLKLADMVKSGALSLQGNEYVIDLSLKQGQLSVNGKPFNSAMLQF